MAEDKIPPEVLAYFREQGKKGGAIGGRIAAANMTPEQRQDRAKKAVAAREAKRAAGLLTTKPRVPSMEAARSIPPGTRPAIVCERCSHKWVPRAEDPLKCPGCKQNWRFKGPRVGLTCELCQAHFAIKPKLLEHRKHCARFIAFQAEMDRRIALHDAWRAEATPEKLAAYWDGKVFLEPSLSREEVMLYVFGPEPEKS